MRRPERRKIRPHPIWPLSNKEEKELFIFSKNATLQFRNKERSVDMFEFVSNVRYSEVDYKCDLKWLSLLDYFQDCSVAHSEKLHVGTDFLAKNNVAWILIGWQIHLEKMPRLCDKIHVRTWPYEMKDFYGKRNFEMVAEDGTRLAYADTTWVMVNASTGKPVKILPELLAAYEYEPRIEMESMGRKMRIPAEYEEKTPVEVPVYFIDTNHHMNNGRYLQVALSYVPEGFEPTRLQIEYRKEARLGDYLYPRVTVEEDSIVVVLADKDGVPYSIVKFVK